MRVPQRVGQTCLKRNAPPSSQTNSIWRTSFSRLFKSFALRTFRFSTELSWPSVMPCGTLLAKRYQVQMEHVRLNTSRH